VCINLKCANVDVPHTVFFVSLAFAVNLSEIQELSRWFFGKRQNVFLSLFNVHCKGKCLKLKCYQACSVCHMSVFCVVFHFK